MGEPSDSEVDQSLIELMRTLTPHERLELHDRMLATALELRDAFREFQANQSAQTPARRGD